MKRLLGFCFTALAVVCFLANGIAAEPPEPPTDMKEVVAGNAAFATDLYGQLKGGAGNLFFSPYSLSTALAMTSAGARGDTLQQMVKALHFEATQEQLHPSFAALQEHLKAVQQKGNVQLSVANSLWPQKNYPFRREYIALLKKQYGTSVTPLDYQNHTEKARQTINDWVEARTNHRITDLIKPGILDRLSCLVLANAIYFKGNWAAPFNPKWTNPESFHVTADKEVKAPMMAHHGKFRYTELRNLQVLELPYAGNDLSMIVLLPMDNNGLGALEERLTAANLAEWTGELTFQDVAVKLPKFKATCEVRLDKTLAAMGMINAFDSSKADLSAMGGNKGDLYISAVLHKAFVDVNEEGTEAAAASAVVVARAGLEPRAAVFRADHPFVFLIRDNQTGSVLFLGRIMDPTL